MIQEGRTRWPELPLYRMCQLLDVSRALLYRKPPSLDDAQAEKKRLLNAIDRIVLEFPGYGYRRVTAQLTREGWSVNHKRILALMKREGLLCKRRFRTIRTTNSRHGLSVYPNLVKLLQPDDISKIDQLWVADLTYIRLPQGFCYLAAVLDAYSRRVVGWALGDSLEASLAVEALQMALKARNPCPGLIHHSDRGVQYASREYVRVLEEARACISMSGKGKPRDNAQAESFFRTVKVEEVYVSEYENLESARAQLGRFLEVVYNERRLHSSIGYLPPVEFEENLKAASKESSPHQDAETDH
jgi:putative transposase